MENIPRQEQPGQNVRERNLSPLEFYSNGLMYFTAFMSGLSQVSLYLLGNYAQSGTYPSSYNQYNRSLKLPATSDKSVTSNLHNGKTSFRRSEEILTSVKQISENYFSKNAPSVLQAILEFICLAYTSNFELRKHIRNINAKYRFHFGDNDKQISLEIKNAGMRVFPGIIDLPDVSLKFRDSEALRKLFFSDKPDILEVILKQDVVADGNLTYLFKLIYLLNHLQLKLLGPV